MTTVIALVAVFGILVSVHESGHYIVAKTLGMRVNEFSLGFGPALFSSQWGETQYSLRIIPLGGYVRIAGMEMDKTNDPDAFPNRPLWQRFSVIFAGPVMNLVLAAVLYILAFGPIGTPTITTTVASTVPHYPAYAAGIRAGDKIVAVDHRAIGNWTELQKAIVSHAHQPLLITIERHGVKKTVTVHTRYDKHLKEYIVGIEPQVAMTHLGFFASIRSGVDYTVHLTGSWFVAMYHLVIGKSRFDLTGPVGIAVYVSQAAQDGLPYLVLLAAALSANLGLFNVLPIPVLDGSRLFLLGLEGVRRKAMDPDRENMIHMVGFVVLILFVLVVTYHDIVHFFHVGAAF